MGNHRKRKNGLGERMLAAFLALAMVFTMLPMDGLQVRAKAEEAEPEFVLKAFHMTNNYVGSETHFNQAPSASIDWEFKNLPEPDGTFSYDLYIYVSPLSPADIQEKWNEANTAYGTPSRVCNSIDDMGSYGQYWIAGPNNKSWDHTGGSFNGVLGIGNAGQDIINRTESVTVQAVVRKLEDSVEEYLVSDMIETAVDWTVSDPYFDTSGNFQVNFEYPEELAAPEEGEMYITEFSVWPGWSLQGDPYTFGYGYQGSLTYGKDYDESFIALDRGSYSGSLNWTYNDDDLAVAPEIEAGSSWTAGIRVMKVPKEGEEQLVYVSPRVQFSASKSAEGTGVHSDTKPTITNSSYDVTTHTLTLDFTTEDTATGYFDVYMITENKPEYDPADTTPVTFSKPGVSGSWYLYATVSLDYGTSGVTFDRKSGKGRIKIALDESTLSQGIKNLPKSGEVYYIVLRTEGIPEGGQPGQGSAYSSNQYLKVPLPDPQNVYVTIGTYQEDKREFNVNIDPSNPSLEEFTGGKWVVAVVRMDKDEDLIYHVAPMKEDLMKVATGTSGYVTYAKDKYDRYNWQWCNYTGEVLNPDNPWIGYNSASIDASMGTIPVSVYQFPGTTADFEEGMKGFYDGEDLIIGIQAISKEDPTISSNLVTVRVPLNEESKNKTFRPSDLNEEDDPVTPDPVITQPSIQNTAKTIYSTDTSDFTLTKSDGSFTFDSIQCDGETLTLNTDYTKAEKTVTLKQSWLSTLIVGEHTVIFHYTAGEGIGAEAKDPQLKLTVVEKVSPVVSVAGYEKADITSHCNIAWYTNASRTTRATLPVIVGTKLYYTVTPGDDLKIGGVQYYKEARGEVTLNEEGQEVKVKLPMQGSITLEPVLKGGTKLKRTDQAGYTINWSVKSIGSGEELDAHGVAVDPGDQDTEGEDTDADMTSPIYVTGTVLYYSLRMTGEYRNLYPDISGEATVNFGNHKLSALIGAYNNITLDISGEDANGTAVTSDDYSVTWYEKQGNDESSTYKRIGTGVMLKNIQSRIGQDVYYEIVPHDYYNYNTYDAVYNWLRIKGVPLDETKTKVTVTDEAQKIDVSLTAVPEPTVFSGKIENYDAVGMENLTFSISQDPFADYLAGNSYYSYGSKWNELNKSITVSGNGTFTARVWDFDLTLKISDKNDNFKTLYKTVQAKDLKDQVSVTMAAQDLPSYIPLEITRQYPYANNEGFSTDTLSRGGWWSNEGIFNDMEFTLKKGDTVIPKDLYTVTPSSVEFTGDVSEYFGMGDTLTLSYTVKDIMGETQKTSDSVKVLKYYSYSTDSQAMRFDLSYKEYGNIYARSKSWSNIAIYSDQGELVDTGRGYYYETSGFKAGEYTVVNFANNDWLSAPSDLAFLREILSEDEYLSKNVTVQNGLRTKVEFDTLPELKARKTFTESSKFSDEIVKANGDEWALIKLSYEVDPAIAAANAGSQYVIKVATGRNGNYRSLDEVRPVIRYDSSVLIANTAVKDKYFSLYRDGRLKDSTVMVTFIDNLHLITNGFNLYTTESAGDIYFYAKQSAAGEYSISASGMRLDRDQNEVRGSKQSFGNMTLSVNVAGAALNFASDYLRTSNNGTNYAWVYTTPDAKTSLYMDDVEIVRGDTTGASGMCGFNFDITDSKVGSASISAFREKDPGWTLAGEHELYAVCKKGDEETRSAVSIMSVVTGESFTPAVLKTVRVKTISDNPNDPMTGHEDTILEIWKNRIWIRNNYWSLSLEKSNLFTYEFTVETEDGANVSEVYLTLTAQDGEDHVAILTRDGDSNNFVGRISGEKLLFSNWSIGIRSKLPDTIDASMLDADIEELIAKYGENIKVYNPETGMEQTIREYYTYIYEQYIDAYDENYEQLMQDKMEVLDIYLDGAAEFDSFLEGEDFDYSTFDCSEESLKALKDHFGIHEGVYADIDESVWAEGDYTEATDENGRKIRALQTAEMDDNNHLIMKWYSAVLPTDEDPLGYSCIQGLDCGSLTDEDTDSLDAQNGQGDESLDSQRGGDDGWPTMSKAGINKLLNCSKMANAIHNNVVGTGTTYSNSLAGIRANMNVGALQTAHRQQTKAQMGIETAVDGLLNSNKMTDDQKKLAQSCKDDIRKICRDTECSDFAQAMKQITENINVVSEAINDVKEKVGDTLEKGLKEKLKNEAKEKARDAAKEAIENKTGVTIPTDLKEACGALLDAYSSGKLSDAEKRAIELYIKLEALAKATNTRIPGGTSRSVTGQSAGGYARAAHDPEGIIYEAVLSNPVEGATATLYERDAEGEETQWDASAYGQINPQITTGAGWYQWFVPEGEWQVRVTAPEGSNLQDNTSADNAAANLDDGSTKGWLPVMPVQLGINIPLVSTASPEIKAITVNKEYMEAEFSLYIKAEDLTNEKIVVKQGNTVIPCKIVTLDLDHDPLDETKEYARRIKLEPVSGEVFAEGVTYAVTVKAGVTAYNGKKFDTDTTLTGAVPVHTHIAGKETIENEIKPTCTQKGSYDVVTRCTICNTVMKTVHQTKDALGHDWNAPTYTWSADNKTVTAKRICKADASHVETETVAVSIEIVKAPTETQTGQRRLTAVFKNAGFAKQVKEEVIEKLTKENELKANTLKVKAKKTVTVKYSKLKKKNQKIAAKKVMTVSKNKGKVTYKLKSVTKKKYKKYFKVAAKTGKITVVKKLPKGTYKLKIKVTAAGNDNYKAATKTVTVKIKVK